ncbi:hypothetical protein NDU88_004501 [Pleurodeles waltl]|uniref:Uncharacterized protein n=1 Tax=Pleurodeles waltl TaxID=8319 RepID=A0AAV7T7S9_PLEWA|nr:hypothetical protein NDU88_004501 [Pleurodeles waltl]
MSSIGHDRVAQAVELLREAGCLDLLVRSTGDVGCETHRASEAVAVQACAPLPCPFAIGRHTLERYGNRDLEVPGTAPRPREEEKVLPCTARQTPTRDINITAARRPSPTSAAHQAREHVTAPGKEQHDRPWQGEGKVRPSPKRRLAAGEVCYTQGCSGRRFTLPRNGI